MDNTRQHYPVTIKHGDEVIFETQGFVDEVKGEPYDTARAYTTAVQAMKKAVQAGAVSQEDFNRADVVVIAYPDGQVKSYTDAEADKILNEYSELNKYRATRNSKVIVTVEGGFTGGLIKKPVGVALDKLGDADFQRVSEILDLLQTRGAKFDYTGTVGDFGYYVKVGDQDTSPNDMKLAFRGGSFSKTPMVVKELEDILKKYVEKDTRGFGGRG